MAPHHSQERAVAHRHHPPELGILLVSSFLCTMATLIGDGVDIEEYPLKASIEGHQGESYTEEHVNFLPKSHSRGGVNLLRRTEESLASMGSLVENAYFHLNKRERPPSSRSQKRYHCVLCLGGLFLVTLAALVTTLGLMAYVTMIQPAREKAALERTIRAHAAHDAALVHICSNITWQEACAALTSTAGARRRRQRRRLEDEMDDDDSLDPGEDYSEESIEQKFLNSDDPTVVYDDNCIREYRLTLMYGITFPYRANHLLTNDGHHTMALFIQHGARRDAADYFCSFMDLMRKQSHHNFDDILLIAPHFQYGHDDYLHPRDAFWNTSKPWGDWRVGAESDPKCCGQNGQTVSSFTVLDNMLAILTNKQLYPNLEQISFLGHSAGGQMVQRYAVMSTLAALWDLGLDVKLRFVIANPSSYTYLDNRRFQYNCGHCSCSRRNCTCDRDCTESSNLLAVPTRHGSSDQFPCYQWNYDRWPYGLGDFINKHGRHIPYALRDGLAGPERALRTYGKLDVVYMVGQNDTCNDGLPHCDESCWKKADSCSRNQMDIRCPAMLQGPCRRTRAYNYMNFLQQLYSRPTHTLWEVPGVGHDASAMFGSDIGLEVLFGP